MKVSITNTHSSQSSRVGIITATQNDTGNIITFTVTHLGVVTSTFTADNQALTKDYTAGNVGTVNITSSVNGSWMYIYDDDRSDWLSVNIDESNLSGTTLPITITAELFNNYDTTREGCIILKQGSTGNSLTITVTQSGWNNYVTVAVDYNIIQHEGFLVMSLVDLPLASLDSAEKSTVFSGPTGGKIIS